MREQKTYTCTVEYTEGCEKRLTEALVDLYYQRKKYGEIEAASNGTAKEETA